MPRKKFLAAAIFLIVVVFSAGNASAALYPTDQIFGYWSFDSEWSNSSHVIDQENNHLMDLDSSKTDPITNGALEEAYHINSRGYDIWYNDGQATDGTFSMNFWVNDTYYNSSNNEKIIAFKGSNGERSYFAYANGDCLTTDYSGWSDPCIGAEDSQWDMYTITIDIGNDVGKFYYNGNEKDTFTPGSSSFSANNLNVFGFTWTGGSTATDQASYDDLAIYDKVLSQSEIDDLYTLSNNSKNAEPNYPPTIQNMTTTPSTLYFNDTFDLAVDVSDKNSHSINETNVTIKQGGNILLDTTVLTQGTGNEWYKNSIFTVPEARKNYTFEIRASDSTGLSNKSSFYRYVGCKDDYDPFNEILNSQFDDDLLAYLSLDTEYSKNGVFNNSVLWNNTYINGVFDEANVDTCHSGQFGRSAEIYDGVNQSQVHYYDNSPGDEYLNMSEGVTYSFWVKPNSSKEALAFNWLDREPGFGGGLSPKRAGIFVINTTHMYLNSTDGEFSEKLIPRSDTGWSHVTITTLGSSRIGDRGFKNNNTYDTNVYVNGEKVAFLPGLGSGNGNAVRVDSFVFGESWQMSNLMWNPNYNGTAYVDDFVVIDTWLDNDSVHQLWKLRDKTPFGIPTTDSRSAVKNASTVPVDSFQIFNWNLTSYTDSGVNYSLKYSNGTVIQEGSTNTKEAVVSTNLTGFEDDEVRRVELFVEDSQGNSSYFYDVVDPRTSGRPVVDNPLFTYFAGNNTVHPEFNLTKAYVEDTNRLVKALDTWGSADNPPRNVWWGQSGGIVRDTDGDICVGSRRRWPDERGGEYAIYCNTTVALTNWSMMWNVSKYNVTDNITAAESDYNQSQITEGISSFEHSQLRRFNVSGQQYFYLYAAISYETGVAPFRTVVFRDKTLEGLETKLRNNTYVGMFGNNKNGELHSKDPIVFQDATNGKYYLTGGGNLFVADDPAFKEGDRKLVCQGCLASSATITRSNGKYVSWAPEWRDYNSSHQAVYYNFKVSDDPAQGWEYLNSERISMPRKNFSSGEKKPPRYFDYLTLPNGDSIVSFEWNGEVDDKHHPLWIWDGRGINKNNIINTTLNSPTNGTTVYDSTTFNFTIETANPANYEIIVNNSVVKTGSVAKSPKGITITKSLSQSPNYYEYTINATDVYAKTEFGSATETYTLESGSVNINSSVIDFFFGDSVSKSISLGFDHNGQKDVKSHNSVPSGIVKKFTNSTLEVGDFSVPFSWGAEIGDFDGFTSNQTVGVDYTVKKQLYEENATGAVNETRQTVTASVEVNVTDDAADLEIGFDNPPGLISVVQNGNISAASVTGVKTATSYWTVDNVDSKIFATEQDTSRTSNTSKQYLKRVKQVSSTWSENYSRLKVAAPTLPGTCGNCTTKTVGLNGNAAKNYSYHSESDFITESHYDFKPSVNGVTLGVNYIGKQPLELANNVSVGLSNIGVNPPMPAQCSQNNNSKVDIGASATTNFTVEFSCNPGVEGSPVLGTNDFQINSTNYTQVWFNTTNMEIYSNETENKRITWKISKASLSYWNDRNTSSVSAIVDGKENNITVTDDSSYVYMTVGTNFGNSSLHEGTHTAKLGYYYMQSSTSSSDGSSGGGGGGGLGGGGDSGDTVTDPDVEFSIPPIELEPRDRATQDFDIVNSIGKANTVNVMVPDTEACRYVKVRKSLTSTEYGKSGVYNVGPNATVESQVLVEMPNATVGSYSCTLKTSSSYGSLGEFTVTVGQREGLCRKLEEIGFSCGVFDDEITVAGDISIEVWKILIFVFVSVLAAWGSSAAMKRDWI